MYTIREAAARAGVAVATLRAWERRYGIVRPERSAAAYRLYANTEIETLTRMRRLVDSGWSPSTAAAALLDGDPAAIEASSTDRPGATTDVHAVDGGATTETPNLIERFTQAAIALDQEGVGQALDDMLARGTFERVAGDLLLPALRSLGDAWAGGRLSVAGEHSASHAVLRRLAAAFEAAGSPSRGEPEIVVALPPGARHELGALSFSIAARRGGLPIAYLGADLPIDDWRSATENAAAAVIGVPTTADVDAAMSIVRRLHRERPDVVLAVGGSAAPSLPGVLRLPEDLTSSVDALRVMLRDHSSE